MIRLVQLGVLGVVVLGATVLMALPKRDAAATTGTETTTATVARGGGNSAPGDGPAGAPAPRDPQRGPAESGPLVRPDAQADGSAPPPTPPPVAPPAAAGSTTHTIQAGETLQKIAKQHYGAFSKWRRIADANPGVDPTRLRPGTTLVIP